MKPMCSLEKFVKKYMKFGNSRQRAIAKYHKAVRRSLKFGAKLRNNYEVSDSIEQLRQIAGILRGNVQHTSSEIQDINNVLDYISSRFSTSQGVKNSLNYLLQIYDDIFVGNVNKTFMINELLILLIFIQTMVREDRNPTRYLETYYNKALQNPNAITHESFMISVAKNVNLQNLPIEFQGLSTLSAAANIASNNENLANILLSLKNVH